MLLSPYLVCLSQPGKELDVDLLVLGVLPLVALTALVRTRHRAQARTTDRIQHVQQPDDAERLYCDVRG